LSSEYRAAVANTPVTPPAGQAAIYTRTVGGVTTFYILKDNGVEVQIPPVSSLQEINADVTQNSGTVANADTSVKTFSLPANTYTRVRARATGFVRFAVLSTLQDINLKIKYGAGQVGQTVVIRAFQAAVGDVGFSIEVEAVQTGAVTIAVTQGAAAADANTTVFINSLVIDGVI